MRLPQLESTAAEHKMTHATRLFAAGILTMTALQDTQAQVNYPNRPLRIIVPVAPGGPPDVVARLIAAELTKRWGRPVVVEARPGAGTIIGSEIVAKAAPDGYTLLLSPGTLATNPASYKKMPYDALRDFAPITQTHLVPNLFVIHPSLPAKSVKEFIALARAQPGEVRYGTAGHGTNPHLAIELFASMTQIRLFHVPYKGSSPGLIDLVAGRVAMTMTSTLGQVIPHVRSGRLRALGVSSAARSKTLPEMPTVSETVPGYEAVQWAALMAPAATPRDIIERLHKETVSILRMPEIHNMLATDSTEAVGNTPEEMAAFLKSETVKWAKVAKLAGIEPE
jgi:tripartite-type tricarboxylate transporter receptor subunit TctC